MRLTTLVSRVTSFRAYATKHETPVSSPEVPQDKPNDLDYPTHPFSPDLCDTIAKLPIGFSDIALSRQLSLQMIELLVDLHEQQKQQLNVEQSSTPSQNGPPASPRHHIYAADKCLRFLQSHSMPELERMICGGLLAYSIASSASVASSDPENPLVPRTRRTHTYDADLQAFLAELARYTYFHYEEPVLLWVVFSFAAVQDHVFPREGYTSDESSSSGLENAPSPGIAETDGAQFFHHTILRFKESGEWVRVENTLSKFLWSEERLKEWREKWNDCVDIYRPKADGRSTPGTSTGKAMSVTGSARWRSESPG